MADAGPCNFIVDRTDSIGEVISLLLLAIPMYVYPDMRR